MDSHLFLARLSDPEEARKWLVGLGVRDPDRGVKDLEDLAGRGGLGSSDVIGRIAAQLDAVLPR